MINRNRKIDRADIGTLALADRARIEQQITDARAAQLRIEPYRELDMQRYVAAYAWRRYLFGYLGDVRGKRVLDVCCGYSMTPVLFAMAGARVVANDVAPLALEQVRRVATLHGVAERIEFFCGPAEQLPYPDKCFDLVYGGAAIHHLQIANAGRELSRVLRRGGRGGFQDPLGHNVLLEFARDNLNYSHKHPEKGTDQPLKIRDIQTFGRCFDAYSWRGFDLAAMAARATPRLRNAQAALERLDATIFDALPPLQYVARFAVTLVSN